MTKLFITIELADNGAMVVRNFDDAVAWVKRTGLELRVGTVNPAAPDEFICAKFAVPPAKKVKKTK